MASIAEILCFALFMVTDADRNPNYYDEENFEKVCRKIDQTDRRKKERKKERKNANHASDMTQVKRTSDEKIYFKQPVEELNLVLAARDWDEIEILGHKLRLQKDSELSFTIISTNMRT